jgi:hypothetical protein
LHRHDHQHHGRDGAASELSFSLLPISAWSRLAIAALLLVSLWLLIVWALA